jgi:hypothetical protein
MRKLSQLLGKHESFEERCHFGMRVKRNNMRYLLVRAHYNHTTSFPVHTSHIEDVGHGIEFGAKDLFVVL